MIRLGLISDSHFDHANRLDECVSIHRWIADDCRRRAVDGIALGGDLFERGSTIEDRNDAAAWVAEAADVAPVFGVYGNHEKGGDLEIFNLIKARHPVVLYDRPTVHVARRFQVACLPWPRRASFLAASGEMTRAEANQLAADALRDVLRGLGQQMDELQLPRLFLGHVMMRGSKMSTGQPLAPGADFEIGTEDLALVRANAYLLGHIHQAQEFTVPGGGPCFYPGSPRRTSFGEHSGPRFYAIVEVDEETGAATYELVPTPAREMVLIEAEWKPDVGFDDRIHDVPRDAEVRIRYHVAPEHREAARREVAAVKDKWLSLGNVHSVKLDEQVEAKTTSRAPEVAKARTTREKLEVMWSAQSRVPDEAVRRRLFDKLAELEA